MITYTFTSEQGKSRTISTIEEAKSVIIATATVREHSRKELMNDKDIVEVANVFQINLNDLLIVRSVDPNDFYYTYSFITPH